MSLLKDICLFLLSSVLNLLTILLIIRFYMQWQRLSFKHPLGNAILTLTNWIVLLLRRFIAGFKGYDWSSFLAAWLSQLVLVICNVLLVTSGFDFSKSSMIPILGLLGWSLVNIIQLSVYCAMLGILAFSIMSFTNPNTAFFYRLQSFFDPPLRPIRRLIKPIAGLDFSPIILLLILEICSMLLKALILGLINMVTL